MIVALRLTFSIAFVIVFIIGVLKLVWLAHKLLPYWIRSLVEVEPDVEEDAAVEEDAEVGETFDESKLHWYAREDPGFRLKVDKYFDQFKLDPELFEGIDSRLADVNERRPIRIKEQREVEKPKVHDFSSEKEFTTYFETHKVDDVSEDDLDKPKRNIFSGCKYACLCEEGWRCKGVIRLFPPCCSDPSIKKNAMNAYEYWGDTEK